MIMQDRQEMRPKTSDIQVQKAKNKPRDFSEIDRLMMLDENDEEENQEVGHQQASPSQNQSSVYTKEEFPVINVVNTDKSDDEFFFGDPQVEEGSPL